jgi:predicted HTH transcriptional regulator
MIACKINEYMDALIAEPEVMHERSVPELITLGESATLEFKSTLQWDVIQNRVNKDLRFSILKTIAAFLNSAGGTLIIGVEDNGTVFGLGRDLQTVKGHSLDGYEQLLSSLIGDRIGTEYAPFVKIRFEQLNGESVCAVDVEQAQEPAFIDGPRGTEFYIRHSNTTRALDPEETHRYVQMNWE